MSTDSNHEIEVNLYSDGACSGNPGPGGWAFILEHVPTGTERECRGAQEETTNNQMELRAVIEGLSALKRRTRVNIVTDSSYVQQGITNWIHGWKRRGWKRKTGGGLKPVKNVELWQQLDKLTAQHDVTFELVRGHSGHPMNERCDELAVEAYQQFIRR